MSSLSAIRQAISDTILAAMPTVAVSPNVKALNQLPAVIVEPCPTITADFTGAMGRGTDEWMIYIYVIVSRRDEVQAQLELDTFITGAGPNSIRQVLFQNPTCGLADTTVTAMGVKGYGGHFKDSGIAMSGAILVVKAYTSGSS